MKKLFLMFSILILLLFSSCANGEKEEYTDTDFALDTVITITAYGENAKEAVSKAFYEIHRIEGVMSAHDETSELGYVNAHAKDGYVEISEELYNVISASLEISKDTDGAFDITVKPLADLWNIKSDDPSVPSDDAIREALENVGYENVVLDGGRIHFLKEGVKLDLGGAAKGYCADMASEVLSDNGIKDAILDLGGNIFAMGEKNGKPWRVGLRDPEGGTGDYYAVEELSNLCAVTSGSYERYFEKDGKIYHHILDPKTGKPADNGLLSVTVICSNSMRADMLSTALFVLGNGKADGILKQYPDTKVVTVDKNGNTHVFGDLKK